MAEEAEEAEAELSVFYNQGVHIDFGDDHSNCRKEDHTK
jgi:hypothetical protein